MTGSGKGRDEKSLLFGVMAAELKLISQDQLADALSRETDPSKSLAEVLLELEYISPEQEKLIRDAVEVQLNAHKGDPHASLAAFGGPGTALESIGYGVDSGEGAEGKAEGEGLPSGKDGALDSFGGHTTGEGQGAQGKEGPVPERVLEDASAVTAEQEGRYTIKSEQGRGGIGRVLLAFDEHIGRDVALKELLPDASGSIPSVSSPLKTTAAITGRFLQEARITGQLEHPGIVPVYEVGKRPDGSLYYTMRLVRGRTLYDRIHECENLQERLRLLPHFLDLCNALAFAHSRGVVHRDIKPQNVMLGEFGETVLLDWGLAKIKGIEDKRANELEKGLKLIREASGEQTITGKPIGTPSYMPPEQADGRIEDIDERSDVYSLGAVLYEILTGNPPYSGTNAYAILGMVLSDPVPPVRKQEPAVPQELAAICEKCLQKESKDRYADAGEVAEDVVRFQTGGLVSAYEYNMALLAWKWMRKHWPLVSTVLLALIVLASLAVWSYIRIGEEKEQALEQKAVAMEQKKVATEERDRARKHLSQAFFQYGLRAQKDTRLNEAMVFFARSAELEDREKTRNALYKVMTTPVHPVLSKTLAGHPYKPRAAGFSPDGKWVLSASCAAKEKGACDKSEVRLWSVETGKLKEKYVGSRWRINALAVSPAGDRFLTGSCGESTRTGECIKGEMKLWSVKKGEYVKILPGHKGEVRTIAYSPDGKQALSGGCGRRAGYSCFTGEALLRSMDTGEVVQSFQGHNGAITSVAFSPSGSYLLTGGEDETLILWSAGTGEKKRTFSHEQGGIYSAAFSPDERYVVAGGCAKAVEGHCREGMIKLWPLGQGAERTLTGHESAVELVDVSPGGTYAVSAGCGRMEASKCRKGEIKLWDLHEGECMDTMTVVNGSVTALRFSPDGSHIMTAGSDKKLRLWLLRNPAGVMKLEGFDKKINVVAFSPDGERFLTAGSAEKIKIWSRRPLRLVRELFKDDADFQAAAFSSDGSLVMGACPDGSIEFYNAKTGETVKSIAAHKGMIKALDAPAEKNVVLSAGADNALKLWAVPSGDNLMSVPAHDNMIMAAAISDDGAVAVSSGMKSTEADEETKIVPVIKVWDLETGTTVHTFSKGEDMVMSVEISPNNSMVLAGDAKGTIRAWQLETGKPLGSFKTHQSAVNSAAFMKRNGRLYLATGSEEGGMKLWRLSQTKGPLSNHCILSLRPHVKNVADLEFAPQEDLLLSAGRDRSAVGLPLPDEFLHGDYGAILEKLGSRTALGLSGFNLTFGQEERQEK
ncbi:MAG: protein kinase [bacterium]